MKITFALLGTMMLALLLLCSPAAAQKQMMGKSMMGAKDSAMQGEHAEHLKQMQADLEKKTKPLARHLMARKLELKAELLADSPDKKKVDSLVEEINRLNGEIFKHQVAMHLGMSQMGMHEMMMQSMGMMGSKGMGMGMMGDKGMGMMGGKGMGMMGGKGMGMMGGKGMGMGMMSGQGSAAEGGDADDSEHTEHHPQQ